jgi:hypothetical protein
MGSGRGLSVCRMYFRLREVGKVIATAYKNQQVPTDWEGLKIKELVHNVNG